MAKLILKVEKIVFLLTDKTKRLDPTSLFRLTPSAH